MPMPVISSSLFARFASRQAISPTMQAVSALRGEFGGHKGHDDRRGQRAARWRGKGGKPRRREASDVRLDRQKAAKTATKRSATAKRPPRRRPTPKGHGSSAYAAPVHVRHLSLIDFRSYPSAEVAIGPGDHAPRAQRAGQRPMSPKPSAISRAWRAIGSRMTLRSCVSARAGPSCAVPSCATPARPSWSWRSTRARPIVPAWVVRRSGAPEVLGTLRSVLFAPEDLALVRGDRRCAGDFSTTSSSSGNRAGPVCARSYDRILKQTQCPAEIRCPHVLRRGRRARPVEA